MTVVQRKALRRPLLRAHRVRLRRNGKSNYDIYTKYSEYNNDLLICQYASEPPITISEGLEIRLVVGKGTSVSGEVQVCKE